MRRIVAWTSLVVLALVAGTWFVRNPERKALDDDARKQAPCCFVTTAVGTTHYQVTGHGERVALLVHGFSVPAYIWDSTAVALADAGYRVIRFDLLGRGWSDRPDVAYDGTTFDAQIIELLDSLHVPGPVDLFGLSFGGLVVAQFAADHPERVRTLVMVDPTVSNGGVPGIMKTPVLGAYLWQVMVVPGMPAGQPTDFLHPERFPGWEDRYREQMRFTGFGRALLRSRDWMGRADFAGLHARIARAGTPVLLVWGKQDPTIPFASADILRQRIPSLEFVPVDSSGHLPQLEQTALFNAAMLGFLARHPPAAEPDTSRRAAP